jgi:hypothetical protein
MTPRVLLTFLRRHIWLLALGATWGLWFLSLWPQWLVINKTGIATSHLFMWGDWAVHFTFINHLRVQPFTSWFSQNPIFVLAPFTYPPVSSLISALLMRIGLSLWWAVILPSIGATGFLLSQLWRWFRAHKFSERTTYFGMALFLLSGAWGYKEWLTKGVRSLLAGDGGAALSYPDAFVTKNFEQGIDWVNPIVSMALPQRAFLIGFPLLLFILMRIKKKIETKPVTTDLSAGIDLGLLSFLLLLTHSHSFFVLGFLSAVWFVLYIRHWKLWFSFAGSTLLLVVPWYLAVMQSDVGGALAFTFNIGWMSPNPFHPLSWITFWLINWGWFVPAMVLSFALMTWKRDWKKLQWYVPFGLLFIFANIVSTQRWEWDNTKLFIAVLVGILPAIFDGWRIIWLSARRHVVTRWLFNIVLVLLILVQIFPGWIDMLQLSQPKRARWEIASPKDMAFAKKVEAIVPPSSPVLTGDLHNQPTSMLAGRTLILGFQGWVWSYGFTYADTAREIQLAYAYVEDLAPVLKKYGARYAVVGPHEHWQFGDLLVPEQICEEVAREIDLVLYDCQGLLNLEN